MHATSTSSSRQAVSRAHPHPPGEDAYAYFWTFEEAAKATLSLYGSPVAATLRSAIQDRLVGRRAVLGRRRNPSSVQVRRRGPATATTTTTPGPAGSPPARPADERPYAALTTLGPRQERVRYVVRSGWVGFPGRQPGGVCSGEQRRQPRPWDRIDGRGREARSAPVLAPGGHLARCWTGQGAQGTSGSGLLALGPENGLDWDKVPGPDGGSTQPVDLQPGHHDRGGRPALSRLQRHRRPRHANRPRTSTTPRRSLGRASSDYGTIRTTGRTRRLRAGRPSTRSSVATC